MEEVLKPVGNDYEQMVMVIKPDLKLMRKETEIETVWIRYLISCTTNDVTAVD